LQINTRVKRVSVAALVGISFVSNLWAEEIRVVDRAGLVRAVGTVKKQSTIILELDAAAARETKECVLSNIDGLSAERRVLVGPDGRCVFRGALATSWQVEMPQRGKYKVHIDG
jgi:hypothetical protein